jgi:hypothetical protein
MQSARNLIDRVKSIVKDKSFTDEFILEKLNDGLADVAIRATPPELVAHEVELELDPGDKFTSVPSDFFGGRIYTLYNQTDDMHCKVCYRLSDFVQLSKKYQDSVVRAACLKGRTIHCAGIPTKSTILLISYLKAPVFFEDVQDDGSGIIYLPERVGDSAVVNYAAMQLFALIEDGVDGASVNTSKMLAFYEQDLSRMIAFFGPEAGDSSPETVSDMMGISMATISPNYGWGNF